MKAALENLSMFVAIIDITIMVNICILENYIEKTKRYMQKKIDDLQVNINRLDSEMQNIEMRETR